MVIQSELKNVANKSEEGKALLDYLCKRQRGIRGNAPVDVKRLVQALARDGFNVSLDGLQSTLKDLEALKVGELIEAPGRRPKFQFRLNPVHIAHVYCGSVSRAKKAPTMVVREHMSTIERPERLKIKVNGVEIEGQAQQIGTILKELSIK